MQHCPLDPTRSPTPRHAPFRLARSRWFSLSPQPLPVNRSSRRPSVATSTTSFSIIIIIIIIIVIITTVTLIVISGIDLGAAGILIDHLRRFLISFDIAI
jgi:hypothetical protein